MPQKSLIGNSEAQKLLFGSIAAGSPHAFLISGPAGVGKGTLADAAVWHALGRPPRSADLDLLVLGGSERIGIEEVRSISHHVSHRPVAAPRSVVVIHEAQRMTQEAANALLVTLESPPPYALLLLTAPSADHVLPTIRSRCIPIALHLVNEAEMLQGLRDFCVGNKIKIDKDGLAELVTYARGRPARAVARLTSGATNNLNQATAAWITSDVIQRLKLAGELSANPEITRKFLSELILIAPSSLRPGLAIAERRLHRNVSARAVLEAFAMLDP